MSRLFLDNVTASISQKTPKIIMFFIYHLCDIATLLAGDSSNSTTLTQKYPKLET